MTSGLKDTLARIAKEHGEGTVMRLGDPNAIKPVEAVSTQALTLDLALGIGGMPRGGIVEVFGAEMSGKTTLLYHVLAEAQAKGPCAFIDAEHSMDPAYAKRIGVDVDNLLISQPDYGEQGLEVTDLLVRSGGVAAVVVDSVAALTPKVELEGQMGDQVVGLHARLMSQAMRKLAGNVKRTNTLVVFTNQLREKIGVPYGPLTTQPGGRALKFYAWQRIELRRIATLKKGEEATGIRVRAKVAKNKNAAPHRTAEYDIDFGLGISYEGCLIDKGLECGAIEKAGNWLSVNGTRFNGRDQAKAGLAEDAKLAEQVREAIVGADG